MRMEAIKQCESFNEEFTNDLDMKINKLYLKINGQVSLSEYQLYISFLLQFYSNKQVSSLIDSYFTADDFWICDTIKIFISIHQTIISFDNITCDYKDIHKQIWVFSKLHFSKTKPFNNFPYKAYNLNFSAKEGIFDVSIPLTKKDLYSVAYDMNNSSIIGYDALILKSRFTLYSFYESGRLKFVIVMNKNRLFEDIIIKCNESFTIVELNSLADWLDKNFYNFMAKVKYDLYVCLAGRETFQNIAIEFVENPARNGLLFIDECTDDCRQITPNEK